MATFRPWWQAEPEQKVVPQGEPKPAPVPLRRPVVACGCCEGRGRLWRAPHPAEGGAGTLAGCAVCGSSGWREVGR